MQIKSEAEMIEYGKKIATELKGGDVILLYGDLGAGKTTLTKGIANYFGIENVVSPTFTLMQVYEIQKDNIKNLVHIDTYRLEDEKQLYEIGAEDYIGDPNTICVIEWPEKLEKLLENKDIKKITIENTEDGRKIII